MYTVITRNGKIITCSFTTLAGNKPMGNYCANVLVKAPSENDLIGKIGPCINTSTIKYFCGQLFKTICMLKMYVVQNKPFKVEVSIWYFLRGRWF